MTIGHFVFNQHNFVFPYVELAAAEAQAERPRRRRTSSRSRRRTLSGRSISDHSDMETDLTDADNLFTDQSKSRSRHGNHSVLNGATMEVSADNGTNNGNNSDQFQTELTEFIKDKLFSRYVLSMSELTHLLHVRLSQDGPDNVLGTGVNEIHCEQTVIKLGGLSLKSKVGTKQSVVFLRYIFFSICFLCTGPCRFKKVSLE